jgi:hypothetical protein
MLTRVGRAISISISGCVVKSLMLRNLIVEVGRTLTIVLVFRYTLGASHEDSGVEGREWEQLKAYGLMKVAVVL